MYPTKSMSDYKTEMNLLFSRIDENEYLSTPHTNQSFSQYLRSSSSTETSPESFPDLNGMRELCPVGPGFLSPVKPDQSPARPYHGYLRLGDNQSDYLATSSDVDSTLPQPLYETPLGRYDRPTISRQIISENRFNNTKTIYEELQQTPPKSKRQFYELFPADNTNEFQANLQNYTPLKVDFKSNFDLNLKYGKSNNRPRFNMSNDNSPNHQKSNDASPKYELPYFDFSPNSQHMCNTPSRFDRMSRDHSIHDRMSNETLRYDRMPMDTSRYDRMVDDTYPRYSQNPNEFSPRYWQMSNDTSMFETMSNDTTMFETMSNDTTMFETMSNDTAMFDVMSNDTTMFDVMSNEASLFDRMSMDGSLYHQMSNYYSQNVSPMTSPVRCHSNSTQSLKKGTPFKEPLINLSTSKTGNKLCTFCRKNGETPLVYTTHKVKEKVGSRNVVTCPILRSHICSSCGATGDDSHTISYCPLLRRSNNGQPLPSTTVSLKSTRVKSNGMVRRRH